MRRWPTVLILQVLVFAGLLFKTAEHARCACNHGWFVGFGSYAGDHYQLCCDDQIGGWRRVSLAVVTALVSNGIALLLTPLLVHLFVGVQGSLERRPSRFRLVGRCSAIYRWPNSAVMAG